MRPGRREIVELLRRDPQDRDLWEELFRGLRRDHPSSLVRKELAEALPLEALALHLRGTEDAPELCEGWMLLKGFDSEASTPWDLTSAGLPRRLFHPSSQVWMVWIPGGRSRVPVLEAWERRHSTRSVWVEGFYLEAGPRAALGKQLKTEDAAHFMAEARLEEDGFQLPSLAQWCRALEALAEEPDAELGLELTGEEWISDPVWPRFDRWAGRPQPPPRGTCGAVRFQHSEGEIRAIPTLAQERGRPGLGFRGVCRLA